MNLFCDTSRLTSSDCEQPGSGEEPLQGYEPPYSDINYGDEPPFRMQPEPALYSYAHQLHRIVDAYCAVHDEAMVSSEYRHQ